LSSSAHNGPVVVTVQVGPHSVPTPTTTVTVAPPKLVTGHKPMATGTQDPPAHHGNLPMTGAPLVMEATAALALLAAGTMTAIAARRQRRVKG
jgi:hypothetical protein